MRACKVQTVDDEEVADVSDLFRPHSASASPAPSRGLNRLRALRQDRSSGRSLGGARLAAPLSWPIALRRTAILTFPVAIPLWLVLLALAMVASIARDAAGAVRYYWTEPPKRRGRAYYGRYYRSN